MECVICDKPIEFTYITELVVDGEEKPVHNDCLIDSMKYLALALNNIAFGQIELSQDKAILQRDHYVKMARSALELSKWQSLLLPKYEPKELKDDF